ncbi:8562_t:CDS:10 [Ambispora gerdemannii]|uniref:amidophosphoribosyltransferase n=1 Tax=Ambispora gerdemannii TaxID=144530 RepID=A0A9N8W1U4_9GLOM|nr:8562_t:CDS:10 [Ambispora gerdemannii]
MSGDTKLILALITRIGLKLPCNSGKKLETIEADPLVMQTVNAIVDLSRFKLSIIAKSLTQLLENISKPSSMVLEDFIPIDILQSQLFILKILSACVTHHWKWYRGAQRGELLDGIPKASSSSNSNIINLNGSNSSNVNSNNNNNINGIYNPSMSNQTFNTLTSIIPNVNNNGIGSNINPINENKNTSNINPSNNNNANNNMNNNASSSNGTTRPFKLPKSWDDPPQLEDSLAKYILSVLSRFLHQMASQEDNSPNNQPIAGVPGASTPNPGVGGGSAFGGGVVNGGNAAVYSTVTYEIICDIFKNAGRVIFYISASNWGVVFLRIKNRMSYLTSTHDEWPETAELKLLECSDLNSKRLSMVLQELCGTFLHLKRSSQTVMAVILRKAIWNWIEVFPAEFVTLCQSQKRMEGGPEILFDICYNLADNTRRKTVFWPLQTMLLILCPDILLSAAMADRGTAVMSKKALFLETLKKSLRKSALADVAAVCYVDICKASTYVAKSDNSALRLIVPEIENELKEKLFDPNRPFTTEAHVDQRLMTDCLTALFRLNPRNALHSLISVCLQENAPNAFKLVLVKSCYDLASEENRLPWNPNIASMYSILVSPLRKLFQDHVMYRDRGIDARKPRRGGVRGWEENEKTEIILNILKLYKIDPSLAVVQSDSHDLLDENRTIICITQCLNSSSQVIRTIAAETLLQLHDPDYIERWGPPENKMDNFWCISSQVMLAVARQVVDSKEREEGTKYMLELLYQLLVKRNEFLKANRDVATVGINIPERLASNIALEVALLVLLCSADTEICSIAVTCFGHLCTEAQLTEDMDEPNSQLTIVENMDVYLELSLPNYTLPGRMAQQKRTRRLLRLMKNHTHGNLAAWEEAFKRWQSLNAMVAKPVEDPERRPNILALARPHNGTGTTTDITEVQTTEWHNYTGFLSALGGCCVNDQLMNGHSSMSMDSSNRRISANPQHDMNNYHSMVEEFVEQMVDLLVCDSVYVRETVKETLGADLSPRLYVILFKHLEKIVAMFFDADGEANCLDRYTLFIEQAISVLKLILDRIQDASENLYAVDFGGLVLSFARYLHRLGTGHVALRIKVKMCQLCETLMAKKDYITLRQEITLRNKLLEIIIEWTSDFSSKADGNQISEITPSKNERLHRDLDQACLKTVYVLLAQLPLQPSDTVHEADLGAVKARLFYKYFSFFIKLLNRCRILEAIDSGTHSAKNNQDLQMLLSKSKEYVKDLGPLKDYTILALSNLLSANVDAGLKYSLSMGYHEDAKTRTAFMQVLTNILQQGTEFDGLAENAINDRYEKLVELIIGSDLSIALSLCDVCPVSDIDEVAQMLLTIFESRGRTMSLLKTVIEKEVSSTLNATELLRRNCMATKLLSVFAKMHGSDYLRETLQPVLQNIANNLSNERSFEIDEGRIGSGENIQNNLSNLDKMAQLILDEICASAEKVPRSFREVCYYISTSTEERFPQAKFTAVGAFIFLRFFCPVIVAPDSENLVKQPISKELRRGLLLITKIITNIANNVLFGTKEPYMTVLNDFLEHNIAKVTTFLQEISLLHKHLFQNVDKIGKDLITRRVKSSLNPLSSNGNILSEIEQTQTNKRAYDKLSTLLAHLGPPPETQKKEFTNISSQHFETNHHLFTDFMRRNSNRNLDYIKSKGLFYGGGLSKEKRPVFYFIARRLSSESTDMDLLMYHVLHTMEASIGKPFEVVIDLTQFTHANEIQTQWIQQFIQILPFNAVENLANVYMYNPNTAFKKFSKKLPRPLSQKIGKKAIFMNSLSELHEYITQADVRLPKTTVQLDSEPCTQFTPVTKISHYRITIPVIMKISNETIQVITTRKQDLLNGQQVILNDIYHISEIEDITLSSHKNDDNEFVIKQDEGRLSIAFTSPRRDQIMQAIRASKARFQLTKPSNVTERVIRPSDVPGTLLNMALLNIGSDDPGLRLAAYNLLVALSVIFNFDVGNQLLSAKGLCIPANNSNFVVSLSERLAMTEPGLTIEFLNEFFCGFKKSSTPLKHLCLQYMAPWLLNLAQYSKNGSDNQPGVGKIREILRKLIELTTKETEMYTSVQSKIWNTLGKVDEITNLIISEFVAYAVEHGINSSHAETVANTIVTLSSVNVRGKIISRLRRAINRTSLKPTRTLTENPAWNEIAVLVRFNLMLSFNNRLHVQLYLPELFYIVSVLVATGPAVIRSSIHGLVVNLIQSLCTAMPLDESSYARLTFLLREFSEPKFRLLFGLNNVAGNAFVITGESAHDIAEMMPLTSLEQIVQALLEIMVYMSNTWRARWMSLVASTAFQHNPAIQPRAFVALGCLAREEVDDDLLYQILVALRGALLMFSENDVSLIMSIIMCLTNIVENLDSSCRYIRPLFWLAMSLVQIGNLLVFPSAIKLLQVVLRALDVNGFFEQRDIAKVLLEARAPLTEVASMMDHEAGINYEHFSFAVAAALLKGLKHPATKTDTQAVLNLFLEIASKSIGIKKNTVDASMLGYLAALLPISAKNAEMKELLWVCGLFDMEVDNAELANTYYKVFQKLDIPDNQTALLLISLMVAMLQNAEHEPERLFLYGFLSEAAVAIPEVFALVHDTLQPKMNQIITSSDTLSILDAVQSILYTVVSEPLFSRTRGNHMPFLEEIGFKNLMECGSFHGITREKMRANALLATLLLADSTASASIELFEGLQILQHRGQDAAGIVTCGHKGRLYQCKGNGMVRDIFDPEHLQNLVGNLGIGHVRYPTAGTSSHSEAQPFYVNSPYGIVFGHNGNLINAKDLRNFLDTNAHRHINTDSDSELLLNIFANNLQQTGKFRINEEDIFTAITGLYKQCIGGYACVAMIAGFGIIGFRDPNGIRPICLGKREGSKGVDYMFASESVALDASGFSGIKDIKPGEAIIITKQAVTQKILAETSQFTPCIFEYVYFARPDSVIDGISVYRSRLAMGEFLADQVKQKFGNNDDIDVVIPVPDTSRVAALQVSYKLKKLYREGFIKNRYVGRTFIMPGQHMRRKNVRRKLNAMALEFADKNVLIVDDSIVRGTTSKEIVQMARDAGAKKVYFASCAPAIRYPNVYGIDMPSRNELVAHNRSDDEIAIEIGADKVIFQDLNDLIASCHKFNQTIKRFDCSVFDGKYITDAVTPEYLENLEAIRNDRAKSLRENIQAPETMGLHNSYRAL